MKNLSQQLRRGLGLRFWLVALASLVCVLFDYLQSLLRIRQQGGYIPQGYHDTLFSNALSADSLIAFLPVLAAVPLAAGYLENVKSKFARFLLVRGSYGEYLAGQIFACWLCGGLVVVLGVGAAYGLTVLLLTPVEQVVANYTPANVYIGERIALVFLNGGLWALLGMTLSTIMESKYIAYASPFIVYYLLVILYERYFPEVWLLYPKNWLDPEIWPYGIGSAALFLLELTFLCGLVFYIRGKRRLEQL